MRRDKGRSWPTVPPRSMIGAGQCRAQTNGDGALERGVFQLADEAMARRRVPAFL